MRRYQRHFNLPEIGIAGQEHLKASSVLLVGAGGLGTPLALYLAAAGVGRIGIVEFDRVEESNLHRQVLYGESDLGRPKLEVAVERLAEVNPHVEVVPHPVRLSAENALDLIESYDVVADGSDNFPTRYLVNDACVILGRPNVFGSILRFEGQLSVFAAGDGPCYRCLFPEPPPPGLVPNCAEGGVLGILPGIIGSLQANEVVKLLLGIGEPMIGRFLTFDALSLRFRELQLRKASECPICSLPPEERQLMEYVDACEVPAPDREVSVQQLAEWLDGGPPLQLIDVREPHEWQISRLEGASLIPLRDLPGRLADIARDRNVVVYCHHGIRSLHAVEYLRSEGLTTTTSLQGGIDAWSRHVDPDVARY
ncbi:MAG: molybdopterin-synthase adenylyltransferase MoeB [Thermoanaerobaculia bacterium]|nr:molybdopterin-synthase adenylyltransferase MoeB [Thermoanaerobaculia bacterium]